MSFPFSIADSALAAAVRTGLSAQPKTLPPWLFYDDRGSRLFERITALPEYYLTRTEREIFSSSCEEIIAQASNGHSLRIAELGAGSAEKTRILLAEAARKQGRVVYEPVDVSASALECARTSIEKEIPAVTVQPHVADYTREFAFAPAPETERRLVLYIGSSIGNFGPEARAALLTRLRAALRPGDSLLLGVDLVKDTATLVAAYDDAAGVTAAFNRNLLFRLNRELGANFDPASFAHRALWNPAASRMEMHLESLCPQQVRLPALDLVIDLARGERIHTENCYKYRPGEAEKILEAARFASEKSWSDARGWFALCLGRARD